MREESKDLKLLMGKKGRGGMSKRVGLKEGGVCGLRLLNEEAEEPFLLLSNCMLLCLCLGGRKHAYGISVLGFYRNPLMSFTLLLVHFLLPSCVHLSCGGPREDTQWSEEPVATGPLYC